MQRDNYDNNLEYDYRGKRALVLLRVSTEEQEKKYGFPAQLRSIREKVLEPCGLRIPDEKTHIIRDTYTGMEFRERAELFKILEMARRKEFDVLVMDVLDRLGRVGMPREIYRAELKMLGIHFLTTKEEEHADDDSMLGQMIRLWHGWKSEGERNDIIRRTQNGKRERVLEDHMLLGTHEPKYGWKWADDTHGAYILNDDPIVIRDGTKLLDGDGEPWTAAKVRRYMMRLIDEGRTVRSIAKELTERRIPTSTGAKWDAVRVKNILADREHDPESDKPILAHGYIVVLDEEGNPYTEASVARLIGDMNTQRLNEARIADALTKKGVPTGKESDWHAATIHKMLQDEYMIGQAAVFKHRRVKEPGKKPYNVIRPKDEWIYLPDGVVPPILITADGTPDVAWFERVQKRLAENQQYATRNNQRPENQYGLLRAGHAKCGYCGGNLTTHSAGTYKTRRGYRCTKANNGFNRCVGVTIEMSVLDREAWLLALDIIRNPSEADAKLESWKKEDPNKDRREYITGELTKIKASRARLTKRLEDEDLDDDTYSDIKRRLKEFKDQKDALEKELTVEINVHEEWRKAQEELKRFHRRCAEMREQLDDPEFQPDYKFMRDAIVYFGIVATVWKSGHKPRIDLQSKPPYIVSKST